MSRRSFVHLRYSDWLCLHVREWGMPTGMFVGKAWRNGEDNDVLTMTAILPGTTSGTVVVQTREVRFTETRSHYPKGWRKAFAEYIRDWPASARYVKRLVSRGR